MVVKFYEIDDEKFQQIATAVFESVVFGLVAAGEITSTKGERILDTYAMVRVKKGWFGRSMDKLFSEDANASSSWVAKLVSVNLDPREK